MFESMKPGVLLKFRAHSGQGAALAKVITDLHYVEDADGPVDWLVLRDDETPEMIWVTEVYRDQESFARHYAESNEAVEQRHDDLIKLLAEPPMRVMVHSVASS